MTRIVVLDGFTVNPGDNPWAPLEALGTLSVFDRSSREQVAERAAGSEIVIVNKAQLSATTLAALPSLRGVCVLATGVNTVDLAAATALGVPGPE